jgi:hypothetical protein
MQTKQLPRTSTVGQSTPRSIVNRETNPQPAPGAAGGRVRRLLVWSALMLLAALALTLALVVAELAAAPADPAPLPKPPMQFGPAMGHARAE